MNAPLSPQDQVFWYIHEQAPQVLSQDTSADVVIVGGGMAGLTAAQHFNQKGLDVVVLEKNYCGAGASGKSSGFITPGSELSLANLIHAYGKEGAQELWNFVVGGVNLIENTIHTHDLMCDYMIQDTLVVANTKRMYKNYITQEYTTRSLLGYPSTVYSAQELSTIIGSHAYYGGIAYTGTFGINAYRYCQGMKNILTAKGVKIFEETPALSAGNGIVATPRAQVKARHIVLCVDRFLPTLNKLPYEVYHAQTFIALSAPLNQVDIQHIFPHKKYMMWDTDLVYQYFRLTHDNRLLLGGASAFYTFAKHEIHASAMIRNKLARYLTKKFPSLNITFEYMWPGLIGISKDLVPLAGPDKNDASLYYIAASTGLPWAAALGRYSAEHLIDGSRKMDAYFSPYRSFLIGHSLQRLVGRRVAYAVSNYLQVR